MINKESVVVYQIYPRSFYDSNNDGIGDLKGIQKKLDYLKELGVDYLWITPFFSSPQNDNGYDIKNYYQISKEFGTMGDLRSLIKEAKRRGIGLMLDMVFNHTSTHHEWFQKALKGDEKYQNRYFFVDGPKDRVPTNWESKFGGSAWKYVDSLGKWYLHLFDESQADLNWRNEEVREEMKKVLMFWKNEGICGFRFDVINLISKPEIFEDDEFGDGRRYYTDGPEVAQYLREMVKDCGLEDMITVGEMSNTTIENCNKYSANGALSMCFNFHHLKVDYKNGEKWTMMPYNLQELKRILTTWQLETQKNGGWNALFMNCHDQPRSVSRFGEEGEYHARSAKMLATVEFMQRGTPYIYQGEEIGMTNAHFTSIDQYRDVESTNYYQILQNHGVCKEEILKILAAKSRDNARTPMQWNRKGGFTEGISWIEMNPNSERINCEAQINDSDSIYSYYRALIKFRKQNKIVQKGLFEPLNVNCDSIFAFKRVLNESEIIVYANFSGEKQRISVNDIYCVLLSNTKRTVINETIELEPFEVLVLGNTYGNY